MAIVTIILSSIFTPVVGVPVGLLGSAYWIQNKKRK
ncbi:VraH family peptide resistance protein [Staphylococcus hominis]|nr:VraH family protein [Staphylococcus hominis]MCI2923969.1 VraH family protein [Staphylococcus hominis]MDK7300842.1 VraH family protein [Staphylococcus hominis]MDS3914238.1 VraH family protein [Staphylococcus hominis]